MSKGHFKVGYIEGTGASINIQLGFTPAMVEVYNTEGLCHLVWTSDMPDAKGMKTITAGTVSYISSLGITPYAGTAGADSNGFTIGADTDINVSGEDLYWVARGVE